MTIIFSSHAQQDKEYWDKQDKKIAARIEKLLADIKKTPFRGLGKPESLRFDKSGYWSRRINHEHRLIYKVFDGDIYVVQCRYHYK